MFITLSTIRRGWVKAAPAGKVNYVPQESFLRSFGRTQDGILWHGNGVAALLFAALLLLANFTLLFGTPRADWVLLPTAVIQGEWWRVLLHPWVHVSGYHLLLDAGAFLILFFMLERKRPGERWVICFAAGLGASASAWFFDPAIAEVGFCGLSGIGHGLFAAVCVQWIRREALRKTGLALLGMVMAKVLFEAAADSVFLAGMHPGNVGIPLTVCHLGGAIGGIVSSTIRAGGPCGRVSYSSAGMQKFETKIL